MADCREISEKLTDFVEGELSGADQARVTAHLNGCAGCQAEVRSLQALFETIGELPELAPPSGVEGRVMGRVRQQGARTTAPASDSLGLFAWLQARPVQLAGMALLIVLIGVGGLRHRTGPGNVGQVARVESGVKLEISEGSATVEGAAASQGLVLAEGNLLEAGKDFKGRLVYPDGTSIKIRPGTAVRVFSRSLGLRQGQVWLKVKKNGAGFQVETPQAVVAVRGTVFGVDCDPTRGQTQVQLEEGAVELKTQSETLMLAAGQGAKVTASGITRQEGFLQIFELNRDDFVGKPRKNGVPVPRDSQR